MSGYMMMPDGRYKSIAKQDESAKPQLIKLNIPPKKKPAFIKVAEGKKPEPMPVANSQDSATYPTSLHAFVQRCFKDAGNADKTDLQGKLKQMIADAVEKGEMWTRDWDRVRIPLAGMDSTPPQPSVVLPAPSVMGRPSRWGQQAKPAVQSPVPRPHSPSSSLSSRSTRRSYSSDSRSSSRSHSRSRSRSSSRSPASGFNGNKGSSSRKRPNSMKGSPGDFRGKAKKMKQAGPPETKKQRKQRLQQERKAAQVAATAAKKGKVQQSICQDDDGPTPEELRRRHMRAGRFGGGAVDHSVPPRINVPVYAAELARERHAEAGDSEGSWHEQAVQGTCGNLEKKYFRLTGPPNPSAVRPPQVLKAALDSVVRRYRAGQCDIHYAEDQLKAMRQDVTVQHVRGHLPVQIYEAHARACLEHGNGGDFNQCQTQLKVLYEEGTQGCVHEFVAYRVLYQAILRSKESASLLSTLQHISPQDCAHPAVAHALKVRQALVFSRFTAFFQLYSTAPNLGRALMDMCFSRIRFAALETLVDAFKNTKVKILYVASVLGFLVRLQPGTRPSTPTQQMSHLGMRCNGGSGVESVLVMPGCARTLYLGKHAAEVDDMPAAEATIRWLRSCNASVLMDQGGVHAAQPLLQPQASSVHCSHVLACIV